jgi:hypothetical protein
MRGREGTTCTDCHVSAARGNNAVMAQLVLQGASFVNGMAASWTSRRARVFVLSDVLERGAALNPNGFGDG